MSTKDRFILKPQVTSPIMVTNRNRTKFLPRTRYLMAALGVAAGATALWMAVGSFPFHFAAAGAGAFVVVVEVEVVDDVAGVDVDVDGVVEQLLDEIVVATFVSYLWHTKLLVVA